MYRNVFYFLVIAFSPLSLGQEYADAGVIKSKLDCDGNYTNGQKEMFFQDLKGERVVFREKILSIYVDQNRVVLAGDFFTGFPEVKLASINYFSEIIEGEEYTFDCVLTSHCQDGWLDGELNFTNCKVSRDEYVILDDIQDIRSWWQRVSGVSDQLAQETAESMMKNLGDGEMNGIQISPVGENYAFEFNWQGKQLHIKKVWK